MAPIICGVNPHKAVPASLGHHGSGRRVTMAALAALTSVSLVAQERQTPVVLVGRAAFGLTPDHASQLAEVTENLFPGLDVQALPSTRGERRSAVGLSFLEAFDIARGNQVVLQTVRDRGTVPGGSGAQRLGSSALRQATRPVAAALKVAMQHAAKFAEQAASILADERTLQEVKVRPSAMSLSPGSNAGIQIEQRVLDSEVALVHIGGRNLWLLARDVLRVNGEDVPDADRIRLPSLHPTSTPEALRQFEQVAQQGARFNIGIERNVNTPTLALWLLTPDVSPRLVFSNAGTTQVDGRVCDVLAFRERNAPYLFVVAGSPAPVSGRLWVDRGRAAVVKTELSLPEESTEWTPSRATVTVTYTLDPTLSAWVPRTMSERYDSLSSRQFVVAQSTYANFRMFRVASRIIK